MRFLIQTIFGVVAKALWLIPLAIIVILLGTFVFDGRDHCELYCEDRAIAVSGRVVNTWEEADIKWISIDNAVGQNPTFNDDSSPALLQVARLGDSVYKQAGTNVVTLVQGSTAKRFASQESWDSCDCSTLRYE